MLGDVRQCLGGDVVGGRLYRRRQSLVQPHVDVDRDVGATRKCPECRPEARLGMARVPDPRIDALAAIKARRPDLPVLILSGGFRPSSVITYDDANITNVTTTLTTTSITLSVQAGASAAKGLHALRLDGEPYPACIDVR